MVQHSATRPALTDALPRQVAALAILVAAAAVVLVYWPGLAGPFLFDDLDSIGDLGKYGGVDSWQRFVEFVFSGNTGPTGRPLALATFLIDGNNWPTDPWPFKRTNLVIHVLNALLVGAACRQILTVSGTSEKYATLVAVFAALCWALHPFLVSTVLYPVQRMAQLAALFVFAGVNLYLWGRTRLRERPRAAYVAMSAAAALCSVLAVLSKENGALLPVLLAVLEITVIAAAGDRLARPARLWMALFILLPCLLVAAYFIRIAVVVDLFAQRPMRDFSLYERFLTQMRILADYQRHLLLPSLYTPGIFQDGVQKSLGWLQPATTLLGALWHATLIGAALFWRRRLPLAAFAILFFYAGHLVESTYFSLELYFEHRNYLPAAFLFLPIAALAARHLPSRAALAAGCAAALLLGGFTRYSATIWSDYESMVEAAARVAPNSPRAQQQYAMLLFNRGNPSAALAVTEAALERQPHSQSLNVWKLIVTCRAGPLDPGTFAAAAAAIGSPMYDQRTLSFHETLINAVSGGDCPAIGAGHLESLYANLLANDINAQPDGSAYAQITYLQGVVALRDGRPDDARTHFAASLGSRLGVGRAMMMAALYADRGYFDHALEMSNLALTYFQADGTQRGEATGVTRDDVLAFQAQVRAAVEP